jgi:hypothetical protein
MIKRKYCNWICAGLLLASQSILAEEKVAPLAQAYNETELAKESQNPVAKLISFPMVSNFYFNYGKNNSLQYVLDLKPVIPFSLNDSWNLITRTIIPIANQETLPPGGRFTGLGDINPSVFLSPAHPGKIIWGFGPAMILPTATNEQLGQGKYSLGPTFVLLSMPGSWVFGAVVSNVWSIGGQNSRPAVNEMSLQYFVNYNFPHGWFVTSAPILTANWKEGARNRWTIPFGIGGGKVLKIGHQALNTSVQYYQNVKTPQYQSNWELEAVVSLLFPV